ncbi:MAG: methyl-accepting chemotaxis protein [Pseudomonadota bacterium]
MMNLSSLSKAKILISIAVILTAIDSATHISLSANLEMHDLIIDSAILFLSCLALIYIIRADKRIKEYTAILKANAQGDFDARIVYVKESGNIGELANTINSCIDLSDAFVREVCNSMESVSKNHYYRKVIERGLPGIYRRSAKAINNVIDATERKVGNFAGELQTTTEAMNKSAIETSQIIADSLKSTDIASMNAQNVASASEELTASIGEISRQVSSSFSQVQNAYGETEQTGKSVGELNEAAKKVGNIVQLITAIASQTNLLALNATIESARAGEAGKGFAVVANEVKNLANETSRATDEIRQEIEAMQNLTTKAVDAVKNIGDTITNVKQTSENISIAIEQQRVATLEISQNINRVAATMSEVNHNMNDISEKAASTKSSSEKVLSLTKDFASHS